MKKLFSRIVRTVRHALSWYLSPVGLLSALTLIAVVILAITGFAEIATVVLAVWLGGLLPYKLQRERSDRLAQSSRLNRRLNRTRKAVEAVEADLALTPTIEELAVWQDTLDHRVAAVNAKLASLDQLKESMRAQYQAIEAIHQEHAASKEEIAALRDGLVSNQQPDLELAAIRAEALSGEIVSLTDRFDREIPARMRAIERQSTSDVAALAALYAVLDVQVSLPSFASWALSPAAALAVVEAIFDVEAELVVETGSGSSTVVAALALAKQGHGRVIALEHDPAFAEKTRRELRRLGVEAYADVVVTPLVDHVVHGDSYRWYALEEVAIGAPIDLLMVDGPPGTSGPLARYPAVPLMAEHLSPRAVVLLDDVDREDEQLIAHRWSEQFGLAFAMGLADGQLGRGQFMTQAVGSEPNLGRPTEHQS